MMDRCRMNQAFMQCSVMAKGMVSQSGVACVIMKPESMESQTHCMSHTMVSYSKMTHSMMTQTHTMVSNSMMTQTHPMVSNSMVSNSMVPKTMVSMGCSKMDHRVSSVMHCMMHRFMMDHWSLMHYMVLLMHMHKGLEGREVLLRVGKGRHRVRCH